MKVAVIGRGFGAWAMAPAYEAQGFTVALVPSRDPSAVGKAIAEADLVSIHSPPFQHREHVLQAVAAGRAVLCDKPFGRNAAEAREMRDAAKAAGLPHFLNFEFRCNPAWAKARDLVSAGAIGPLRHVSWTSFGAGMNGRPHGWLYDADLAGGWIGAFGSHVIDALRWFFDAEVTDCGGLTRIATKQRPGPDGAPVPSTAEDSFSCWFALAGGGTASLDTSFAAPVDLPATVNLLGTEGAISITGETVVTITRPGQPVEVHDFTPKPGEPTFPAVPLWLAKVAEALKTGTRIAPNFDDGVATAEVIERLKAAAARAA